VPAPIGRRSIEEFRRAFTGEIDSLAALYRDAAADMMDVLADAAALAGQRGRAAALLRQYQVILADLGDEAAAWMEFNIPRAYDVGLEFADEGIRNIRRAGINLRRRDRTITGRRERDVFSQVHREAVQAITESMLQTTNAALAQIGRRVDDVFRREGMLVVARGIAAGRARIEVSRELEQRLPAAGRPVFVDRLGREWPLDRYAEMVARTTTREAMTQGTINRLREHGITLAQVSAHNAEDFCRYYENAIVSLNGPHPVYPPISAINGGPPFHPRCVHVLTPFVERLATEEEKKRGIISSDLLNKSPAELQRRFRKEFPGVARAAGKRGLARAARAGVVAARGRPRPGRAPIPEPELRALEPGTVLRRTYKGREYVAEVLQGGRVLANGQVYRSLTELARDITGQRAISGPAFFGVAERGKRTGQAVAAAQPVVAPPKLPKPKTDLELTRRTCDELSEMVGAKHGYNGDLRTGRGAFGGHKDWDCAISIGSEARNRIDAMLKHDAASWEKLTRGQKMEMTSSFNTLVHEATHAMGVDGAIKTHEYATAAQRWIEEGLTSAAADEMAPQLFERIMGFPSGLDKRDFAGMPSYSDYQQALAKALGGPYAGRSASEPMRGIDPKLYLDLAYRTPRDQRLWELSRRMESYYGQTRHGLRTAVEIEAIVGQSPDHKVVVNFAEEALALQQARP
jgi:hypothetical protein